MSRSAWRPARVGGATAPRGRRAAVAALLLVLTLAGCAGSSRSDEDYRLKTANTAAALRSHVQLARLAVDNASAGRLTGPFVSVVLREAEEDASSVQAGYASRQPPSRAADEWRRRTTELADEAVSVLAGLRIAAYRGDLDSLPARARPLADLARRLEELRVAALP